MQLIYILFETFCDKRVHLYAFILIANEMQNTAAVLNPHFSYSKDNSVSYTPADSLVAIFVTRNGLLAPFPIVLPHDTLKHKGVYYIVFWQYTLCVIENIISFMTVKSMSLKNSVAGAYTALRHCAALGVYPSKSHFYCTVMIASKTFCHQGWSSVFNFDKKSFSLPIFCF